LAKFAVTAMTLLALLATTAFAQEPEEKSETSTTRRHQAGVRLGTWINTGEEPPEYAESTDGLSALKTNIKNVNAYFEGWIAYNLFSQAYLEFSIGIVNRGSVTVQDGPFTDVGNLILYPFLLQFKFYPLSAGASKFQPYVAAGGGIYHGRQDVQFTTDNIYFATMNEDNETDINYVLSGGVDWYLNDYLALDLNLKYMPITFSHELATIRDYKAASVTIGITYLHRKKK